MARIEDNSWKNQIHTAVLRKQEWEKKFKCRQLEDYYEGFQWKNVPEGYNPYTFNEVYSTISIKISSYLFGHPQYEITSSPGHDDYNLELASKQSQLKQDVLNTIILDRRAHYKEEVEQAFKDSWFRFGLIEVGYGADWLENPRAPKPLKKSDREQNVSVDADKLLEEPKELPANERIFFKRLFPYRFFTSECAATHLDQQFWVGYYDFIPRNDLLLYKGIKNKDFLERGGSMPAESPSLVTMDEGGEAEARPSGDNVKIWHIWDIRCSRRFLLLDGDFVTLAERPYTRLPIFDIRWIYRSKGFYPVPPVFHWLSPQDEINESREQLRSHRRRFTRKYQVKEGTVDDVEIDKFTQGPDGTVIKYKIEPGITPVMDANLNPANDKSFVIAKDEFNILTGTSSEMRGVADRTTATQAQLINRRSIVREEYENSKVSDWLCASGREALLVMREKFTTGMWVELSKDVGDFMQEVQEQKPVYVWVTSEDLSDGFDFRITLDITSVSPIQQEDQMKKFLLFLSTVNQFPQIAMSPTLIMETAIRIGYNNQKVIKEFQTMALMHLMGAFQGAQQNSMSQGMTAQATPNSGQQITNQLQNQMPPQ